MKLSGLFVVLLLFVQCNNTNDYNNMIFVKNLRVNENQDFQKYKAYYIIPPAICIGCNTHPMVSAYKILNKNYPAKVIFECFPENYDILLSKLEVEGVFDTENYFIDTLVKYNNYDSLTLVNKPIVIYVDKGGINDIEFLDNENPNAIHKLMYNLQK